MADGGGANSVDRALSIIDAFDVGDDRLALQQIAARTGLNKATIIRLITSLERYGYVMKIGQGVYALGPTFLKFASRYQDAFHLADHAVPVLRDLVEQTNESAAFFIREGDTRICLFKLESPTAALVSRLKVGDRRPLLPSGTGKILLAFSDKPSERASWPEIGESYLALSYGERVPEISSVSAPVFKSGQVLAGALSISGATSIYTPRATDGFGKQVLAAAMELSRRLGGDVSVFKEQLAV